MPEKPTSIKVRPIEGELGRFHVVSASSNKPHLVDLLAYAGQGQCSCTDWTTRCRPNQKTKEGRWIDYGIKGMPNPNRTECKHVHVARRYFLKEVLQGLAYP